MDSYIAYLKQEGYSYQTQQTYNYRVILFEKWLNERKVTKTNYYYQVIKYIEFLKVRGLTKRTISGDLIAIRKYFLYKGIDLVILPSTQIKGIHKTIPRNLLSEAQLEELYFNFGCNMYNLWSTRDKVIVGLFVFQGLSKGELEEIGINDIDLNNKIVWIRGKSRSNSRRLKLNEHQLKELDILINTLIPMFRANSNLESDNLLFSSSSNKDLRNVLPRILTKLRLVDSELINWNQIRASVLSIWTQTNSTRKVQYMAGHKYIGSTERYVQNDTIDLLNQMEVFSPNL